MQQDARGGAGGGEVKPVVFRGNRARPKGRSVDPEALREVRELLGDAPRDRDLLIEHLHRIQDRFGCLQAAHLWRWPPRCAWR